MRLRPVSLNMSGESDVRSLIYLFIVVMAFALLATAGSQAQAPVQKDPVASPIPSPKGPTVRGRIIYEDTRRPLRRVRVMMYDPANRGGRGRQLMAWTNGRGEFQFKDVTDGKYFVTVDAPGIIRTEPFGVQDSGSELTWVTVEGASPSEVVVRVKRGGAISGKVTYADGDPVINGSLRILRKKNGKWVPVHVNRPSGDQEVTDERGIYRLSGLAPGEYVVGAGEERMGVELMAQDDADGSMMLNRARLPTTYFGGAVSVNEATVLSVEAGDDKSEINIALAERPVYTVSGIVTVKGEERPVARARIGLKRKDQEPAITSSFEDLVVNSDNEGRFTFDEAPEGMYMMMVSPPTENYGRYGPTPATEPGSTASQKFAIKRVELNVAQDVTNLMVEVSRGGSLSGVLTVEGAKKAPRDAFVYLESAEGLSREQVSAAVRPDGTFTLGGASSGSYYLRALVQPNNQYYTKSATHGRSDITREPLEIKEGEDIRNVRLVISADVARLSGRVLAADGKSPEHGAGVLLVPADPVDQKIMSRRMHGFTNAAGGFSVSGAPGEYMAIVVRQGDNSYALRGEKLASRISKGQRVTLQSGENNKLDLVSEK